MHIQANSLCYSAETLQTYLNCKIYIQMFSAPFPLLHHIFCQRGPAPFLPLLNSDFLSTMEATGPTNSTHTLGSCTLAGRSV